MKWVGTLAHAYEYLTDRVACSEPSNMNPRENSASEVCRQLAQGRSVRTQFPRGWPELTVTALSVPQPVTPSRVVKVRPALPCTLGLGQDLKISKQDSAGPLERVSALLPLNKAKSIREHFLSWAWKGGGEGKVKTERKCQ